MLNRIGKPMTDEIELAENPKPKVFYDGECPMCQREIKHYQSMRGADNLEWIDITCDTERLQDYGIDYDTAMARFHVLDGKGQWQTGAYGFAELWKHLPALSGVARVVSKLRLLALIDRVYTIFASWRLKSRQQDAEGQQ